MREPGVYTSTRFIFEVGWVTEILDYKTENEKQPPYFIKSKEKKKKLNYCKSSKTLSLPSFNAHLKVLTLLSIPSG